VDPETLEVIGQCTNGNELLIPDDVAHSVTLTIPSGILEFQHRYMFLLDLETTATNDDREKTSEALTVLVTDSGVRGELYIKTLDSYSVSNTENLAVTGIGSRVDGNSLTNIEWTISPGEIADFIYTSAN